MNELFTQITDSLVEGETEQVLAQVQRALEDGLEPMEIIEKGLVPGMDIVGRKYEEGEYFLPNLVVSARAMQESMALLEPVLKKRDEDIKSAGCVVLGTVQGDIHEIGKSLVATMLAVNGFQVIDLGVNVPVGTFISAVREHHANLVGMSALLTTTMPVQKEVIIALEAGGLRSTVKVMVGGAPVTASWARDIGADGFAEDAIRAVELARTLCHSGGNNE